MTTTKNAGAEIAPAFCKVEGKNLCGGAGHLVGVGFGQVADAEG